MAWIICREVDEDYESQNIPWCIKKVSFYISVIFREHHTKLSSSGLDENMGFSERIWKTKRTGYCKSKYQKEKLLIYFALAGVSPALQTLRCHRWRTRRSTRRCDWSCRGGGSWLRGRWGLGASRWRARTFQILRPAVGTVGDYTHTHGNTCKHS